MRTNDAQMLVLSVLTDGPLHGYAINAAIQQISGQRLGAGSLYGAVARLEAKRLVEPVQGVGRRRPIRLTSLGRELLDREAHSMARVSDHVLEKTVPSQVSYLDRVAATEVGRSYKKAVLDALGTRPGDTLLDLGCGPGTDLGALAEAVGPTGHVLGIDSSQEMVDRARARTADRPFVDVRTGDVQLMPLEDNSVDRARTDRVLQHVGDPAQVLAEVRRVLRPGGRLVMAEPDWDSLAIDYPDIAVSRAYTRFVADEVIPNGVIGRMLGRLALEAGFNVPTIIPITSVFRDVQAADQILGLHRTTERAVAAGYLSERVSQEWLADLTTGPFLATVTLYIVVADLPS